MKKNVLLLILIIFTVSSSAITLDQGWNTLSVNSEVDISDAISEDNSCEFEQYEGEYIWRYDNGADDWTHPNTLQPEDGFYLYTDNNCELEVDQSSENNIDSLEMDSGWNMIGASHNQLSKIRSNCEITPHLDNGYFSFLLSGEWYHPIISASEMDNRAYWLSLSEESCQVNFDEDSGDPDEPEEQPVEDNYLKFNDAKVTSETVSADGEGLNVDFSFDRETSTRNEVGPTVGLHIDESSSPVKTFEVNDRDEDDEPQTLSANWQTVWEEVGQSNTDASAQLVLQEGSSQGYSWNEDSIDAGEFTVERCSSFDSEFRDGWEQEIEYNTVDSCLDRVSVTRSEDGNDDLHDFTIRSNSKGLDGEVNIEKTFDKPQGTERLTINIEEIQDLSTADGRYSDIRVRHFEGGPDGSGWNTLLEGQVGSLEPTTVSADFTKSINSDNTHPYNLIQIIVSNDYYNADQPVEVKGSIVFEQYPEDGPGTCQPGQTWCRNAGDCIDDVDYELSRCVG